MKNVCVLAVVAATGIVSVASAGTWIGSQSEFTGMAESVVVESFSGNGFVPGLSAQGGYVQGGNSFARTGDAAGTWVSTQNDTTFSFQGVSPEAVAFTPVFSNGLGNPITLTVEIFDVEGVIITTQTLRFAPSPFTLGGGNGFVGFAAPEDTRIGGVRILQDAGTLVIDDFSFGDLNRNIPIIPLPSAAGLGLLGLAGLAVRRRR